MASRSLGWFAEGEFEDIKLVCEAGRGTQVHSSSIRLENSERDVSCPSPHECVKKQQ